MKYSILLCLFLLLWVPTHAKAEEKLTLQQCYELALDYSDEVAISKEEIQLARARFTQALGEVLPQITFRLTELLQDPSVSGGSDPVGQTFTQLSRTTGAFNFQQIIFRGFQEYQALKISRLDRTRATQELTDVKRLLFQDVVVAFYTITLIERDIETDNMIIGVVKKRIGELHARVDLGKSREGELTQEQALLALLQGDLERKKGQKAVAYEMMSFLTGKDPMPPIQSADPVSVPNQTLDFYLQQVPGRPDLQVAQTTVAIAKKNVSVAKGNFLPTVSVDANIYTNRPGFQSGIRWDAEILAEVPIFKYQNFGFFKEAKVLAKQSELSAQNLFRIAKREVKEAYENFQSSREQYRRYKNAVTLAYKNFQLQNQDFNLGRANNLDVLTAQRTWLDALDQRNRSEVQAWLDWTQLQISSGVMP